MGFLLKALLLLSLATLLFHFVQGGPGGVEETAADDKREAKPPKGETFGVEEAEIQKRETNLRSRRARPPHGRRDDSHSESEERKKRRSSVDKRRRNVPPPGRRDDSDSESEERKKRRYRKRKSAARKARRARE